MSKKTEKPETKETKFVPQPKWADMTEAQREGWKWGARAKENMVKERMGFRKPKDKD